MTGLQEGIDFIMRNRAFFAFLAALAGYERKHVGPH